MKKLFYLAMSFAAVAMTFVSCSKDDTTDVNAPVLSGKTKTITVNTEVAGTRTSLDAEHNISWAEGDQFGILTANSEGQILGMTESTLYSGEGAFEFELTVPEEAAYVCAYYPRGVVTESAEQLRGKSISSIPVSVEADFYGTFAGVNYMAAKGEIAENSTSLTFKPFVTVLEVLVYDSKGTGDDQLSMVTVSSDENICGGAILDLSGDAATLSGWDDSSINGYGNGQYIGTSADDAAVAYVALAKGEYTFNVTVHTYDNMDGKIYSYTHNLEKDGYTVKIDLAAAGAGLEAPVTDTEEGEVDGFTLLNNFDYRYDSDYVGVLQYGFTMCDTKTVTFGNFPQMSSFSVLHYTNGFGQNEVETYEKVTFENGVLTFTDDELERGDFKIFVYGGGETTRAEQGNVITILCVTYATSVKEGEEDGDDDTVEFGGVKGIGISGEEQGKATLTVLNPEDHGYDEYSDCPQYLLEVAGTNWVQFETFPQSIEDWWTDCEEISWSAGTLVFFTNDGQTEFDIIFKKDGYSVALLHVHYSEDAGDEGDEVLSGATSASEVGTVNLSTVSVSDMEKWNSSFPDVPQYYLQMCGTTSVKFENCPSNNIMAYDESMEYDYADPDMGGVVSMKNNTFTIDFDKSGASIDKYTFYVYFYGDNKSDIVATMIVDWTKEDLTGGGDDGDDDEELIAGNGIKKLNPEDEGYDEYGSYYPQYGVTLRDIASLSLTSMPSECTLQVWDTDDMQHDDWVELQGQTIIFTCPDNKECKFYILFQKGGVTVCSLYVDYYYEY